MRDYAWSESFYSGSQTRNTHYAKRSLILGEQHPCPRSSSTANKLHYQLHHGAARPAGPPLVLVHGAGGNLMHWPGALRRLPGHTVYALDLPGHGKSGGAGRAEIGAYADVVRGFAEALGLVPFVLAGHSMGGAIALEFALRYPARLAGLILVGTGAKLRVAPEILTGILDDLRGHDRAPGAVGARRARRSEPAAPLHAAAARSGSPDPPRRLRSPATPSTVAPT